MSASKSSNIPVWDGMVDCWQGLTASAVEKNLAGQPVLFGNGRIHIHWGILWGSRPIFFQMNMITSVKGSNDWIPTPVNFTGVDGCAPRDTLSVPEQWHEIDRVYELYTQQWHEIDAHTDSDFPDWISDSWMLRDGSVERRECAPRKITRSLSHLLETGKLNGGVL